MKKFLSLAIAVIMIMTAFVTMIPAVSATETVTPGVPAVDLTDDEKTLQDAGYVAYVTHSSITAETEGAVEVDGVYAMAFKWLTPGDTTKAKFDAFFALPYASRDGQGEEANYVEYNHTAGSKAYLTDTAWGYVTALDKATVVFLNDVYSIGPCETIASGNDPKDKTDVIEHGGTIACQRNRTIDGNGFALYMEGPICVGNNSPLTVTWKNIHIQANNAANAILFRTRSNGTTVGKLNLENCTLSTGVLVANSGTSAFINAEAGLVDVSLTNCKIDFDASVYDSSSVNIAVFGSAGTGGLTHRDFILNNVEIDFTTKAANAWIFRSNSGSCHLDADLTNVKIDTATTASKASFMRGCWNTAPGNDVDITDCDIKVGGYGFYDMNQGDITVDGTTKFQTGNVTFMFNLGNSSGTQKVTVKDTVTIIAPKLIDKKYGTASNVASIATVKVVVTNPNFYSTEEGGACPYVAPTLVDGASVRTTEGSNGLRFTAEMPKNAGQTEFGTLVTLTSNLESTEFTARDLKTAGVTSYAEVTAELMDLTADNCLRYYTALVNMPEAETGVSYSARAYAKYGETWTDPGNSKVHDAWDITVYSVYDPEVNARSLDYVAFMAYGDTKDAKDEAKGYICPVTVDGAQKWSKYDASQREVLKVYADKYQPAN